MHLADRLDNGLTCSFEFFPPKTDASADSLFDAIAELVPLRPSFVSVTYGAGGSTRERTHSLVVRLKTETPLQPVPHLTCVGHSERDIGQILERYAAAGIGSLVCLRGDPPRSDAVDEPAASDFAYATDLVRFVKREGERLGVNGGRGFAVAVAGFPEGHPECPNRLREIDHLKAKVDAGADAIFTQLFFNNADYYDFRDRCRLGKISCPIVAGIMPITSAKGMVRMADLAAGARFPASLLRAIGRTDQSDEAVRRVGVHWATEQCRDLLDHGVAGIHFYTLNRSTATLEVYRTLGVEDSLALAG